MLPGAQEHILKQENGKKRFLPAVRGMPQRNLAVELLRKLLTGEISTRRRKNVVQARSFAEMLEQTIHRDQNRAIEAAQVIEELIALAKDMRKAHARGEALGLSEDELAFHDALETNDSAVKVLGDETLRLIARELVKSVRNSITMDWTIRDNVRAQMRVIIKRILRKYGYPPDKQVRMRHEGKFRQRCGSEVSDGVRSLIRWYASFAATRVRLFH